MTRQLESWTSDFGRDYLARNLTDTAEAWMARRDCWLSIFNHCPQTPDSVLEVGANIGKNLGTIAEFSGADLHAVEPFEDAFSILTGPDGPNLSSAFNCDGFSLPFEDNSIDFVFTSGVLIHIAPNDLPRIVDELVRVSRRYICCSEYFSKNPEEIRYRGAEGLLFKRDFGSFILDRHVDVQPLAQGFFWSRVGPFDDTTWWLFQKPQS